MQSKHPENGDVLAMFYNYIYEIMKATDLTKKGIIGIHIKNSMLLSHIDVIAIDMHR